MRSSDRCRSDRGIDNGRRPLDVDLIATFDELSELTRRLRKETEVCSIPLSPNKTVLKCRDGRIVEVEIAWSDSTAGELLAMGHVPCIAGGVSVEGIQGLDVAGKNVLYTIKMSHRYLKDSPHFRKTRDDIVLLRENGATIFDEAWLRRREDETYWYKHPKLNVKKGDFFRGDGVQYVYDHDDIHKSMAHVHKTCDYVHCPHDYDHGAVPAYTLYMKDGAEVQCSRDKFFSQREIVRLFGVLEEAQVLALERSQIPFRGKVEPRRSFDIALQKVCTSITSGWFREFAWENFDRVENMYEPDYVDRFWTAVEHGKVRKLEPGETGPY